MTLLADLIRKYKPREVATATVAISANHEDKNRRKIAEIATVAVAVANSKLPTVDKTSKTEIFQELNLLIEYVASNNDFSTEDIQEVKDHANKDAENALISFRMLAKTVRRNRAIELLQDNPNSSGSIYIDTNSDLHNVIITIAIRNHATCEMLIDKKKYDPWKLMAKMDSMETIH